MINTKIGLEKLKVISKQQFVNLKLQNNQIMMVFVAAMIFDELNNQDLNPK